MATEFKLKGLTSIDLKNGQTQEVEVEGVEEGKVLLAKVKDEVHALSPKCTHYGAPLAKGWFFSLPCVMIVTEEIQAY